ncbi:hypothetical protein ACO0QE_003986 [Hanseniaspora vineae]
MKYVSDEEQEHLFLNECSPEEVVEYQNLLGLALQEYSQDPSLNPPRMIAENPHGTTILHMPISSDTYNGIKTLAYNPASDLGFVGNVSCLNKKTGELEGIVSAKVLTGFRTALASCIGLQKLLETLEWNAQVVSVASDKELTQNDTKDIEITVLGSGLQAFWHIVIAIKNLLIYKSAISNIKINVFYRRNKMSEENVAKILKLGNFVQVEQYQHDGTNSKNDLIGEKINNSDIIFGCTPSIHPTLKFKYFQRPTAEGVATRTGFFRKNKITYVSLIGSYKPEMHEADDEFMQFFTKNGNQNIIVDSKEQVLIEAGEFIDNKVQPQNLVEIGQLIKSQSFMPSVYSEKLDRRFVFCKLVGLAVMDISVAQHIIASS